MRNTETPIVTRPKSVTVFAWLIVGETIFEFGLGIFQNLSLLQDSNMAMLAKVAIPTSLALSIIKLLIAIGLLRAKSLARWAWVIFGLVIFVLSMLTENILGRPNVFMDTLKLLWIVSLFFLFRSNVRAYFSHAPITLDSKNSG
jgi:hypothetical protein